MTFDTLIVPMHEMLVRVMSFIPTLFFTLAVIIIGWVVAQTVEKVLTHLLKSIHFDTLSDKVGLSGFLKKGGIKKKPSVLISCLTYWTLMGMFLIISVKSFGISVVSDLVDKVLVYIPNVIAGVFTLIIGMLLAKLVSTIVYVMARNTDMPVPATLSRVSKLAIMIYVVTIFLKEIGFVRLFEGAHFTLFIGGLIFAFALAFGLAGKDVASKYLDVFGKKPVHE